MTRAKVVEKAGEVFPHLDLDAVLAELDRYGAERYEQERDRVQLAILKLCQEERLGSPTPYVDAAKQDFRDVLAWAEYPEQLRRGPGEHDARVIREDRAQYEAWLNGSGGS